MPALQVVGEFSVPPAGALRRDFQTLHIDFGLPIEGCEALDVARFTALYVDARHPPTTAFTRVVPLNALLAQRHFDDFVEKACRKFYAKKMGRPSLIAIRLRYGESEIHPTEISVGGTVAPLMTMMMGATPAVMRQRALQEDEARWAFLALMAGAAFFSLFAILGIMPEAKKAGGWVMAGLSVLGAVTILLSWLVAHCVFAVHYAHEYFYEIEHREAPGLDFPGVADDRGELDYWDFCYFAFVIGMTAQVSDVQVTSRPMRQLVLWHGVLSFAFYTVVLALSINIVAGLI